MVPKESQFEFTFSYWIFFWFLIYYFGYTKYNPKIWLIIGLILNTFQVRIMINNRNFKALLDFFIINFFIKMLPIYLLWNSKNTIVDFNAGIVLLIIFFIWMLFRLGSIKNIIKYFKNMHYLLVNNKPSTPLITLLDKIYKKYKK
jgi:hypothetical protein